MVPCRTLHLPRALAVALMLLAHRSGAQSQAGAARPPQFETRAQLEAAAHEAESQHRNGEAWLLRTRLERGDFQEGDKIILTVDIPGLRAGDNPNIKAPGGNDTVVVRAGNILQFTKIPNIPDLSLTGVLRSELVDTITAHLSKYLRSPTVHAVPLVRLAVMGAVGHPGWYSTPTDVVLADVIMQAGGVSLDSDVENTTVRRAGEVIWSAADVRVAFSDGLSLDRLHLRAGDEIFVKQKRQWNTMTVVQLVTGVVGIYVATRALQQPHK